MLTPVPPYPALLHRTHTQRTLVIADLHIGWEIALAQQGIHVPSQTAKMLKRLIRLIDHCKPSDLLILGDVKHTIAKVGLEEWRDIPEFFEALSHKIPNIQVILGNHDGNLEPLLPEKIQLFPQTGLVKDNVGYFHGNAWPAPELLACHSLVMGHVHPTVAFRDPLGFRISAQVWVKAKLDGGKLARAFLKSMGVKVEAKANISRLLRQHSNVKLKAAELFIMPYFNEFLGGRPINSSSRRRNRYAKPVDYLGPVLRSGSVDFNNAEIYLLDGTFLGTVSQLRNLS
jgi:putative SbcD/Mre11-related phosphoesterase